MLKRSLSIPLALGLALGACGHYAANPQAESAESAERKRPSFVPPFAYEAYVRGELALAANKPQEAVLQFELATAAPEEDAYLLSRLAEAQERAGDRPGAAHTLTEAERVNACEQELWLTRGRWAEAEGTLPLAEAAYKRALRCAPESEGVLVALYRVLKAEGRTAEALALLSQAGREPRGRGRSALLLQALSRDDVAALRFALDTWLGTGELSRAELTALLAQVVARNEPSLALTFKELPLLTLTPEARARLAELSHDRALLHALLAQYGEEALGGPTQAARFALAAHDFERAELYASLAEGRAPDDAARALKIEALSALGEHEAALSETHAISDPALQRKLARAQLARLGLAALAHELEARSAEQKTNQ